MRLASLDSGHRVGARLKLMLFRVFTRRKPPDVVKMLLYRPEKFGGPYSKMLHALMRGPSEWSAGERELFAAFVSRQNQCPF